MSNARVPGPSGSGVNSPNVDEGTLQRSLSRAPGIVGTWNESALMLKPPLLPTSRGAVKPPPTVQFGSRGALVQRLQNLLNERVSPSPQLAINGVFDAATLAAVKQYQQHLRLNVDGRVGRDTWYRLHKGDIAVIPGAPKVVERPLVPTKPNISAWTLEQKFQRTLELTPPKLPGHMREEFMKLLDPTALAIIVGTLIIWVASHAFGVGVIVDIAMLIGGVVSIGMAAIDAAGHIYDFLTLTATADEASDLDQASVMLATAVSILGVGAFVALVTKGAAKRGAKKTAPPEQKPLMKEPGPKLVSRDLADDRAKKGPSVATEPSKPVANKTVFSGHGGYDAQFGTTVVPEGTSITFYSKHGATISDRLGNAIELNEDVSAVYKKTYKAGDVVPNYVLQEGTGLNIKGSPVTVKQDTPLSGLLKPNMGECHWAACTYDPTKSTSSHMYDVDGVVDTSLNSFIKIY